MFGVNSQKAMFFVNWMMPALCGLGRKHKNRFWKDALNDLLTTSWELTFDRVSEPTAISANASSARIRGVVLQLQ